LLVVLIVFSLVFFSSLLFVRNKATHVHQMILYASNYSLFPPNLLPIMKGVIK
jgi:hypothetical protein